MTVLNIAATPSPVKGSSSACFTTTSFFKFFGSKFFSKYPSIKLIETNDTALFAKNISENKLEGLGAIASIESAKMYGLKVLSESIQTIKNNVTRFVILENKISDAKDFKNDRDKDHDFKQLVSSLKSISSSSDYNDVEWIKRLFYRSIKKAQNTHQTDLINNLLVLILKNNNKFLESDFNEVLGKLETRKIML